MAPGGIEPSHAASKAAALSAELRGRARVAEGTRTPDHRDHNPGLYRLSYRHHAQSIVALALPQLESRHHTAAPGSGLDPERPRRRPPARHLSASQATPRWPWSAVSGARRSPRATI